MNRLRILFALLGLATFLSLGLPTAQAQCPQCKANVESAQKNEGSTVGSGLNFGILYILVMPYLAGTVLVIIWYRQRKRKRLLAQNSGSSTSI